MKTINIQSDKKDNSLKRRDFLKKAWKVLGLVLMAELALFVFDIIRPSRKEEIISGNGELKDLGHVNDFSLGSVTPDRANKLFVVRQGDGGFMVLSLSCTHLGCAVLWNGEKQQFICPCHKSVFDMMGNVLSSPAPRALDYFPVHIEAGRLRADLSQKVQRKKYSINQVTYAV
ncbi:MAG: Rieske (2Fe-2S) protein [Bacteroidales bacterium]|nr:Rieske (2Fe-2S) protein [Bacteroidales bacterium]